MFSSATSVWLFLHFLNEDLTNLDSKKELDTFLQTVADEPLHTVYTTQRNADFNSICHMMPVCNQ